MRSPEPAFDLRAALSAELQAAIEELNATPIAPRSVHQCRVRVKRARALARVGRACAPGLSAVFVDSARALMRTLATARDMAALCEAARAAASKSPKKAAAALNEVLLGLAAGAPAQSLLNLEAARAGLKDLQALAQVWPETSARQIRKGAKRIDRRARIARKRGRTSLDPDNRHEWRSREKDRLFAAMLLGPAWPEKRRRATTQKLGDELGAERDALLLMERLAAHPELAGEEKAARRALKALNRRRRRHARRANVLGAKLAARD